MVKIIADKINKGHHISYTKRFDIWFQLLSACILRSVSDVLHIMANIRRILTYLLQVLGSLCPSAASTVALLSLLSKEMLPELEDTGTGVGSIQTV